jgi:hypothetical protein
MKFRDFAIGVPVFLVLAVAGACWQGAPYLAAGILYSLWRNEANR